MVKAKRESMIFMTNLFQRLTTLKLASSKLLRLVAAKIGEK